VSDDKDDLQRNHPQFEADEGPENPASGGDAPLEAPLQQGRARVSTLDPGQKGRFLRVFPGVMLSMFLAAVDQTILATALPAVAGSLGDLQLLSWVVIAYLLTATIAAPVYGRLGDAYGRRRMLFVALFLFIAASLLCAAAPSMLALVVARALQGFGGGGLMTLAQALIAETVPPRERGRYQGYFGAVFASASAVGPVAGGYLVEHVSWQAVFLVNLPLGLVAAALALRVPVLPRGRAEPFRFDWRGTALFAFGTTALLLALTQAGSAAASGLALAAALFAVALAALALFVREERSAASPLMPPELFRQPSVWRSDLTVVCVAAGLISSITYVPVYLQVARGFGASESGLLLMPLTLSMVASSVTTGTLMSRTGRTTSYTMVGLTVSTLAAAGLALSTLGGGVWPVIVLVMLYGAGLGTAMPVMQTIVQVSADPKMLGSATASVSFARSIGGSLGVASVGAALFASLSLVDPRAAPLFAEMVERGPAHLAALPAPDRAVVETYLSAAFAIAFGLVAVFTLAALLVSRTIPRRRL